MACPRRCRQAIGASSSTPSGAGPDPESHFSSFPRKRESRFLSCGHNERWFAENAEKWKRKKKRDSRFRGNDGGKLAYPGEGPHWEGAHAGNLRRNCGEGEAFVRQGAEVGHMLADQHAGSEQDGVCGAAAGARVVD